MNRLIAQAIAVMSANKFLRVQSSVILLILIFPSSSVLFAERRSTSRASHGIQEGIRHAIAPDDEHDVVGCYHALLNCGADGVDRSFGTNGSYLLPARRGNQQGIYVVQKFNVFFIPLPPEDRFGIVIPGEPILHVSEYSIKTNNDIYMRFSEPGHSKEQIDTGKSTTLKTEELGTHDAAANEAILADLEARIMSVPKKLGKVYAVIHDVELEIRKLVGQECRARKWSEDLCEKKIKGQINSVLDSSSTEIRLAKLQLEKTTKVAVYKAMKGCFNLWKRPQNPAYTAWAVSTDYYNDFAELTSPIMRTLLLK